MSQLEWPWNLTIWYFFSNWEMALNWLACFHREDYFRSTNINKSNSQQWILWFAFLLLVVLFRSGSSERIIKLSIFPSPEARLLYLSEHSFVKCEINLSWILKIGFFSGKLPVESINLNVITRQMTEGLSVHSYWLAASHKTSWDFCRELGLESFVYILLAAWGAEDRDLLK